MPSAATSWCSRPAPEAHPNEPPPPLPPRPTSPGSQLWLFSAGINPAYRAEDANEDTIGVLVRLITEKKGKGRVWACGQALEKTVSQSLKQP